MTENQRIKAERQEYFKTAPFQKKIEFIWDYYKYPIVIGLFIFILVGYYIYEIATKKDIVLDGLFLNVHNIEEPTSVEELKTDFIKHVKINEAKETVTFTDTFTLTGDLSTDMEIQQVIRTRVGAATLDFMVSPLTPIKDYAYQGFYCDLRTVLTKEELQAYKPYLMYIDGNIIEELEEQSKNPNAKYEIDMPDFKKPEEMKDPIPVFVDVSSCEKVNALYANEKDTFVYGIVVNTEHTQNALKLLKYLMN